VTKDQCPNPAIVGDLLKKMDARSRNLRQLNSRGLFNYRQLEVLVAEDSADVVRQADTRCNGLTFKMARDQLQLDLSAYL
jgi:hypothetical protein